MADFDLTSFWEAERKAHQEAFEKTFSTLREDFEKMLDLCVESIQSGGKIMFFGNGGSAADAQHLATELSIRYVGDRLPIAGLALNTDTSTLTAAGNDYGFEYIFSRQIEAIGKKGDVAIGLTTSGKSENVLNALQTAKSMGIKAVALAGKTGGDIPKLAPHAALIVPSHSTARIQEMHITLGHMLCGALEQRLGLV